ncbi:hypothetical protein CMI47_09445 [Candidatus Pacearchaeota archaeon]|nr:hypothetical protein [Candidatus Pacearchaeota archaeon]
MKEMVVGPIGVRNPRVTTRAMGGRGVARHKGSVLWSDQSVWIHRWLHVWLGLPRHGPPISIGMLGRVVDHRVVRGRSILGRGN